MPVADWKNVLVVQTSFLGDTVLTLPLLSEIRRRFPVGRLSLLCTTTGMELLAGHPAIDELIVDDKRRTDAGLAGLWRKAKVLEQKRFTLALSPHKSLRSALLLYLAGIPYRVGFRQSKGAFLFNALVSRDPLRHDVQRNLSLLEAFGVAVADAGQAIDLPLSAVSRERARAVLTAAGVDPDKRIVGIHPGSVWPTKRWSAEHFAKLIELLKREEACEIVLFGAPEDLETVERIQSRCAVGSLSLAGKTALRDLPAAIGACDLFITNDSGPMHIAVACHVPVVAIFCATTPSLGFYPYSSNAIVVEKRLSCRPCSSHGGRRCPLGTEDCIRLVRPEDVLQAARQFLVAGARTRSGSGAPYEPQYLVV